MRGVQPQFALEDAETPADLLPFAGAANTENCTACFRLPHFGQVTAEPLDITMRSCRVSHSSQRYSNIGMALFPSN
ncbi:MAG: hypothetical protein WA766_09500 [Candidatus Acidiferrales bacterium]